MSDEARDWRIARIASTQRTMVSAEQLYARGITKRAIERGLKSGRLHPEFRGVYSVGSGALPPLAREQGALLSCGERSFLSHHTAAFIWGLRKVHPQEVEVSVVGRRCDRHKGIHVHQIQEIDRREIRYHEGLWVSSPERAVPMGTASIAARGRFTATTRRTLRLPTPASMSAGSRATT